MWHGVCSDFCMLNDIIQIFAVIISVALKQDSNNSQDDFFLFRDIDANILKWMYTPYAI